ncbi:ClpX, ATPase regulatory subunit [Neocallimastix californiae]|uniref:ClpX, ATPase regulatory subunit n=1 Tax=Neocallimastix californiae TaxID=1754190 RepID=A0A1Y2D0H4_9FUNG|nr:ClpX, ATPase regulatory subunit [Neocallimastix californiae]|eukprot:ORY52781.1 ClpX, ATPase regulatory subunit [Neocallimastix californiae]
MASLIFSSTNNLINRLYKNNILNRINVKELYHSFNINSLDVNYYKSINNAIQSNIKKWTGTNSKNHISLYSNTSDSGKPGKIQKKSLKSNPSVPSQSTIKKTQDFNVKSSSDSFNSKYQQQLNQVKQQVYQYHLQQHKQQKQQQQQQQHYENIPKSKKLINNTLKMSTVSNNRTSKNITMGRSSMSVNPNKIYNSNSFIYNQDVDGKTIFQQQIYNNTSFNNPREIREYIDKYVIGQDKLKQTLSVALYNHYIKTNDLSDDRIDLQDEIKARMAANIWHEDSPSIAMSSSNKKIEDEPIVLDKSNVLLVGPTGTGKTLISKTIAEILDVPYSINDATPFTQSGYVGEDAENSDYDVSRAQKGIVFIDEIDKIARRSDSVNSGQRDVSGEGVQQGLLRLLEGTNVTITVKNNHNKRGLSSPSQQEVYTVNTSNILFICSGAFVGLDKIIIDRLNKRRSIGFDSDEGENDIDENDILKNPLNYVEPEDLIKYGLIPEFVGRLPVLANTNQLKIIDLINILKKPKNSIVKQYKEIFKRNGIQLFFQDTALKSIAELAIQKKTGARGLRRILESILNDIMYEYFGSDYRYVVVSNINDNKPLIVASDFKKVNFKRKSNVANDIINSTKTTTYKYGEEDRLLAYLKTNKISFDDLNISLKDNDKDYNDTITTKENNIINNEDIKHAQIDFYIIKG